MPADDATNETTPIPVGRELDRAVAERVFGRDPLNARRGHLPDGELEYHWGYPVGHDVAPRYSTDIAAAWLVVKEMIRRGVPFALSDAAASGCWLASFGGVGAMGEFESPDAAPAVICRAALKALPTPAPRVAPDASTEDAK